MCVSAPVNSNSRGVKSELSLFDQHMVVVWCYLWYRYADSVTLRVASAGWIVVIL